MYAPQFELSHAKTTLSNFNPRAEKHGDDPKPASDLLFSYPCASDALAMFDPALRRFLYWKKPGPASDLANEGSDAPDLRFPKLEAPLDWSLEIIGATLTVHYGLGAERSDIVISGCAVNKFKISALEGGTVFISFRVQGHPSQDQNGKLSYMIGTECEISIDPPEAPAPDLADQGSR